MLHQILMNLFLNIQIYVCTKTFIVFPFFFGLFVIFFRSLFVPIFLFLSSFSRYYSLPFSLLLFSPHPLTFFPSILSSIHPSCLPACLSAFHPSFLPSSSFSFFLPSLPPSLTSFVRQFLFIPSFLTNFYPR